MASVLGHSIASIALSYALPKEAISYKVLLGGILCSIIPDADVLAFNFGIGYDHVLGHRGLTHSILFAFIWGLLFSFVFIKKSYYRIVVTAYFIICTLSHGFLDAMTNGGRGVAFLAPFDTERYFFPWRFIQVSPLGIDRFFSEWGMRVIYNELIYIGIPALIFIIIAKRLQINNAEN